MLDRANLFLLPLGADKSTIPVENQAHALLNHKIGCRRGGNRYKILSKIWGFSSRP